MGGGRVLALALILRGAEIEKEIAPYVLLNGPTSQVDVEIRSARRGGISPNRRRDLRTFHFPILEIGLGEADVDGVSIDIAEKGLRTMREYGRDGGKG